MTSVEILIRTICEQRRLTLEQERERVSRWKTYEQVGAANLPPHLQNALMSLRTGRRMVAHAERTIKRAGYRMPYGNRYRGLTKATDDRRTAALVKIGDRLRALDVLKVNARVAVLGKSPDLARRVLKQLQKDVRRI